MLRIKNKPKKDSYRVLLLLVSINNHGKSILLSY
ncbi:hypothetical protein MED222_06155 [Vibrio sp. MED222]|nr:hypothetical protein MED222_06155 [Vibrio sp. MED222]